MNDDEPLDQLFTFIFNEWFISQLQKEREEKEREEKERKEKEEKNNELLRKINA